MIRLPRPTAALPATARQAAPPAAVARPRRPVRRLLRVVAAPVALVLAAGLGTGVAAPAPSYADNIVTPGDFTGYGFDQCLAPTQKSMEVWRRNSPFWAVGIYISGKSRACRNQPNLTPAWITTQLNRGWRLLPIALGPQASCNPRFPRYGNDPTIIPKPGADKRYVKARRQGRAEADRTAADAAAYGIAEGSTLWYDLEGFDVGKTRCRESALAFVSGWVYKLRTHGYVPGVYSSAGSGIKALDDARVNRPGTFNLPDRIWIARWDGLPNTSTSYIRSDGWLPGNRMKQYQGGHDEVWGGVRINIDRNWLDLGAGSTATAESHCGGVPISYLRYQQLVPGTTRTAKVKALQCLLLERGVYQGKVNGQYAGATLDAVHTWQSRRGMAVTDTWSRRNWISLLAAGPRQLVKFGSAGPEVRRLQRALNATGAVRLRVRGVFDARTDDATRAWQRQVGLRVTGVVTNGHWNALRTGRS
jgi:peptidoglycan hydrolase-like protein with peptidoglycan-binding domain